MLARAQRGRLALSNAISSSGQATAAESRTRKKVCHGYLGIHGTPPDAGGCHW
jgi:hypothetical protein